MTSPADSPQTEALQPKKKKLLRLIPLGRHRRLSQHGHHAHDRRRRGRGVLIPRSAHTRTSSSRSGARSPRFTGARSVCPAGRPAPVRHLRRAPAGLIRRGRQTGPRRRASRRGWEERPGRGCPWTRAKHGARLEREYRAVVEEILELRGDDGRIAAFLRAIAEPGQAWPTSAGYSPTLSYEQKGPSCCARST